MRAFRVPLATYRIQFSPGFRFPDAHALVPYLDQLGVSDLYSSPRFKARTGSSHGYDVADPLRVNPELGREKDFDQLVLTLEQRGMGLLLDIVPNHMAASRENPWWMDVLEHGPSSPYADFFDIDWNTSFSPSDRNQLLLPVLGEPYEIALRERKLRIRLEPSGFTVGYYDSRFPLDRKSYSELLRDCRERLPSSHPAAEPLRTLEQESEHLPAYWVTGIEAKEERRRVTAEIKRGLWQLYQSAPQVQQAMGETLRSFPGGGDDPQGFSRLDRLLAAQVYRLAYWKTGLEEINYRRFFDIADLVSLQLENAQVFAARHAQILELVRERKVAGLRIDHIDGLYDPLDYLRRLHSSVAPATDPRADGQKLYVVAEKILTAEEPLPSDWPLAGTTGYDFLNAVNRLFIHPGGLRQLTAFYRRFTGQAHSLAEVCNTCKRQVMEQLFPGEVRTLATQLAELARLDPKARHLAPAELTPALQEVTARLPVYRTYIRGERVSPRDRAYLKRALREALARPSPLVPAALAFLERVLLGPPASKARVEQARLRFVQRWQQFTGSVMAKGYEDTALYVYTRLVSLNEVGSDPEPEKRMGVEVFHHFLAERRRQWPDTLNATSTHDTKRSEDVRARLHVLSELPTEWKRGAARWSRWNRPKKKLVDRQPVPASAEELLLYQTLLGAWPLASETLPELEERVQAYMVKAVREAKVHSSWLDPNPAYEEALREFVAALLAPSNKNRFLADFLQFQKTIAFYGAWNSLAQVLLKVAAPGIPDFYQGTELWDFSLVDPDNRRPVDFQKRRHLLGAVEAVVSQPAPFPVRQLVDHWQDGRVKLYLIRQALHFRRLEGELFLAGDYLPLSAHGSRKQHLCAFARSKNGAWAVIVVPRLLVKLIEPGVPPLGPNVWGSTALRLPRGAPLQWRNVLTGEELEVSSRRRGKKLLVGEVLGSFPVALLAGDQARVK